MPRAHVGRRRVATRVRRENKRTPTKKRHRKTPWQIRMWVQHATVCFRPRLATNLLSVLYLLLEKQVYSIPYSEQNISAERRQSLLLDQAERRSVSCACRRRYSSVLTSRVLPVRSLPRSSGAAITIIVQVLNDAAGRG